MPADLVAAAQAGDRAALEALLREHHDRIAAICQRMCGNRADGDDATQEAMIAIVRGLHHFDGRASFATWVYRVATNACLDELRRRKRRPVPGFDPLIPPSGLAPGEGVRADLADAVAAAIDVDAALATVPPEFRVAVVLRDLCGLDYAEIAEVLDVPAGTVRSRIARGRSALADRLGNREAIVDRPTNQT